MKDCSALSEMCHEFREGETIKHIIIIGGDFIDGCVAGASIRCCADGSFTNIQLSLILKNTQAVIIESAEGANYTLRTFLVDTGEINRAREGELSREN